VVFVRVLTHTIFETDIDIHTERTRQHLPNDGL